MDLSTSILGSTVVRQLQERAATPVLRIGRDAFTRAQLATTACYNFTAAANLSQILTKELQAKDTRDLFENIPPESLALPRLGAVSLAVLGAAFEAKGLGGETPLVSWVRRHHLPDAKLVTFLSLKHRDQAELAKERKTTKERKAARRNTAHAHRVRRHEERQHANGGGQ